MSKTFIDTTDISLNKDYKIITNKSIARQSNLLVDSQYKISIPGSFDLLFKIIAEIKQTDIDFGCFMFDIKLLEDILGKRIMDDQIINIGRELTSCKIEIKKPNGDITIGSWFSVFDYYADTSIIKLSFHELLKPYLLQLKSDYTKYDIKYIIDLNSGYSKRLYTILKSKEFYTHDFKIKIENINLNLFGDTKDVEFNELNRIIKKSISEINKKTDIFVEYKTHKARTIGERKRTSHISFSVSKNSKSNLKISINVPPNEAVKPKAEEMEKTSLENFIGNTFCLNDKYAILNDVSDGSMISRKKITFTFNGDKSPFIREYTIIELNEIFSIPE